MDESNKLIAGCASLTLSSISPSGAPHCSYAPFVRPDNDGFYIFISALAEHTENLKQSGVASILIVEDESCAQDIFARRRLTLQCRADFLPPDASGWITILDQLQERHGETVSVLRELPDFSLVRLIPTAGTLVTGFANATVLTSKNSALLRCE